MPASLGMILDKEDVYLELPRDMELLEWNDEVYVIVASADGSAMQIIDITRPDNIEFVSAIQNGAAPDA